MMHPIFITTVLLALLLTSTSLCCVFISATASSSWKALGPGGATGVQNPNEIEAASATNDIVKVGNAFLIATVNGGVWRTTDSTSSQRPHWVNVFDNQPVTCSSMTSLHVSAFNPNTVYAACGASTSSQMGYGWNIRNTGDFAGFAVSTDAGLTWKMANFPPNYSVEDILELPNGNVVAATRGGFYDDSTTFTGGIWVASNIFDRSSWKKTSSTPTFHLRFDNTTNTIFSSSAAVADSQGVQASTDNGQTWSAKTAGLKFSGNQFPFYSCLAILPGQGLFLGVMLGPGELEKQYGLGGGYGQVFYLDLATTNAQWAIVGAQPMKANKYAPNTDCSYDCTYPNCCGSLDSSHASKDRMAIFVIPNDDDYLYVSGNGGFIVAYRVEWKNSLNKGPCTYNYTGPMVTCYNPALSVDTWKPMINQPKFKTDTTNQDQPHVDTRNWGYDPEFGSLFLVSDGGAFVRHQPKKAVGFWTSFNGNLQAMEYLHASYAIKEDRFIGAAQDNNPQISVKNVQQNPTGTGFAICSGDGTFTAVDNSRTPARLFGSAQFAAEMAFVPADVSGDKPRNEQVEIPLQKRGLPMYYTDDYRAGASFLPFFETPYHINPYDGDFLYLWANGSAYGDPSTTPNPGVFKLNISDPASGPNVSLQLPTDGENIVDYVVGGRVDGQDTPDVIVAVSGTTLFTRYNNHTSKVTLPVSFAVPLIKGPASYCDFFSVNVVPCTHDNMMQWPGHGKSMSVAIHPNDARIIAITGWPQLTSNGGTEQIILTKDGGATWDTTLIGNLKQATGTIAQARPQALAFVAPSYLIVGTAHGNFVIDYEGDYSYTRLGDFTEFPRVVVGYNSYYRDIDMLLTATIGRGVYMMWNASSTIAASIKENSVTPDKTLDVILGICIPIAFVVIIIVIWKNTNPMKNDGKTYQSVEEQGTVALAEDVPSSQEEEHTA